jgi:hypothetical protein
MASYMPQNGTTDSCVNRSKLSVVKSRLRDTIPIQNLLAARSRNPPSPPIDDLILKSSGCVLSALPILTDK